LSYLAHTQTDKQTSKNTTSLAEVINVTQESTPAFLVCAWVFEPCWYVYVARTMLNWWHKPVKAGTCTFNHRIPIILHV